MRTLFELSFILLFLAQTQAQNYKPMPDSNAIWTYGKYYPPGSGIFHTVQISDSNNDTIINLLSYHKVFECASFDCLGFSYYYYGAYRNDSTGKTYVVPKDSISEFLLRDFSKTTGDTIYNLLISHDLGYFGTLKNLVVDTVDSTFVNGQYYKRMYLNNNSFEQTIWLEHVGDNFGGPFNMKREGLYFYVLYCMSEADTTFFTHAKTDSIVFQTGKCVHPYPVEKLNMESPISIYPNPFTLDFTIRNLSHETKEFVIYNVLGQKVFEKLFINSDDEKLLIPDIPAGLYLLKAMDQANMIWTEKILKIE